MIMSEDARSRGEPVQIVKIDDKSEEHNFILDEEALNDILNKDHIKDKPVCIISVAGYNHDDPGDVMIVLMIIGMVMSIVMLMIIVMVMSIVMADSDSFLTTIFS